MSMEYFWESSQNYFRRTQKYYYCGVDIISVQTSINTLRPSDVYIRQ